MLFRSLSLSTSYIGSLASESLNFWYHLSQANLIQEGGPSGAFSGYTGQSDFGNLNVPQTTTPELKGISNTTVIPTALLCGAVSSQNTQGNGFWVGGVPPASLTGSGSGSIQTAILSSTALQIDQKIDDGLPLSGNVRGVQGGRGPSVCYVGQWCSTCNVWQTSTNQYNPLSTGECEMVFMNRF